MRVFLLIPLLLAACQNPSANPGQDLVAAIDVQPPLRISDMEGFLGTWVAVEDGIVTDSVVTEFSLTAGGSVVRETMFRGQPHEMVTMYYQSETALMLTHYCAATAHPNMVGMRDADGGITFACMGKGANFGGCEDGTMHMHGVTYHLDGDSLTGIWSSMTEEGELGEDVVFELQRKS